MRLCGGRKKNVQRLFVDCKGSSDDLINTRLEFTRKPPVNNRIILDSYLNMTIKSYKEKFYIY